MKRAKLLLSAITVLAVVGGALAFKVKTNPNVFTSNQVNGKCDELIPYRTVAPGTAGSFTISGSITTQQLTTTCPAATLTVVNDN